MTGHNAWILLQTVAELLIAFSTGARGRQPSPTVPSEQQTVPLSHIPASDGSAREEDARRPIGRNSIGDQARWFARQALRAAQYAAVQLAHLGKRGPEWYRGFNTQDLLLSSLLARSVCEDDVVLDIGCNRGHRLRSLSLFRSAKLVGVDILDPEPLPNPLGTPVQLLKFDGTKLPFEDQSVNVAMLCYVLHHLRPAHARKLLAEARRVTRRTILMLEDSLPRFELLYDLRNRFHRLDGNLEFFGSDTSRYVGSNEMFLTHDDWVELLEDAAGAKTVAVHPLHGYTRYRHHTLLVASL